MNKSGNYRHGGNRTPAWYSWVSLRRRCIDVNNPAYPRYGGRGITVCERWLGRDGFANFLADMGPRDPKLSLDRIDNSKGYEPGNCRWATAAQQAQNTRQTKLEAHEPAQIRWLLSEGFTQREIARFFEVDCSLIGLIAKNKAWVEESHVES